MWWSKIYRLKKQLLKANKKMEAQEKELEKLRKNLKKPEK